MSDEGLIVIMSVLSGHHPALVSSQSQRSFCLTTLPQDLRTFYVLNAKPSMNYEQHQNANQNWMITFKSCVSAVIMCCMIITWLLCLLSCHRDLVSCLYSIHHIVYTLQGIILAMMRPILHIFLRLKFYPLLSLSPELHHPELSITAQWPTSWS